MHISSVLSVRSYLTHVKVSRGERYYKTLNTKFYLILDFARDVRIQQVNKYTNISAKYYFKFLMPYKNNIDLYIYKQADKI